MAMKNMHDLLVTGLTYTLDFEEKIGKHATEMSSASSSKDLKELFSKTETKSKEYAKRIEDTFQKLGVPVQRNENNIAKAMLGEVHNMVQNTDPGPVRDAALITAANQQQLYRVASYGSIESYAKLLGKQDAVKGMTENLQDSKNGDKKFTEIGEGGVNLQAAKAA